MKLMSGAAIAAMVVASSASAQTYSTGFEGETPGTIAGGASEGNSNWQYATNSSTSGAYVSGIAHTGNQSLAIIRTNVNNGTIHGVRSPELAAGAGETSSGAAFNRFESSFWFRSGEWAANTDYFASVNSWSNDRMTWLALDYTGGNFSVYGFGYNQDGSDGPDQVLANGLAQGVWYQLRTVIDFVDGGADSVTQRLFDAGGNQVGVTQVTPSWDGYFNNFAPPLRPVDQLNFASRTGGEGTVFYIDDVSYSVSNVAGAVPEPATWAMMIAGFGVVGGALRVRRRRVAFAG